MMIPIPEAGILQQVAGQEAALQVGGIEDMQITIPIGQEVVPLPEGSRYLGFIFARDQTAEGVEAALREAHRQMTFVITPARESLGQDEGAIPSSLGTNSLPLFRE
jgi:hypothetical protein